MKYFILFLILFCTIPLADAYLAVPPSGSFKIINMTGGNVTAQFTNDFVEFVEGTGVTISANYALNEITFSATGSSVASIHDIGNVTSTGCAINQILQVNATGYWACATQGGGGNMTMLTDAGDVVLTSPAYLSTLFYNGLIWIDRIFSVNNLTPANDIFVTGINNQTGAITTNQFSVNTVSPANDFQITGINNVTGAVTTNQFSVNTITCGGNDKVSAINNVTGTITCTTDDDTSPDTTTASNLGAGLGIYETEVGDDLRFNSLIGGQGITVTDTTDDLTIDTDFKIDTLATIGIDQFIASFDNSTGDWVTKTFSVNTTTCSGSDRVSAINNSTGVVTCSAGGGAGITSINADTTAAQVIAGTTNQITVSDAGATHTINVGTDIVQIDQSNTYTGSNTQGFGSNVITFNSDPADAGSIRYPNTGQECWEASPTGTDQCVGNNSSEDYVWDSAWNVINFGLNPFNNAVFDVAGTGNRLTATSTALGDILKSDGTDFKRLARGSAGQVLKVNAGGTDIEWGTDATGNGGSGIPLPPKKWGELIPRSASTSLEGLLTGCTILATASFVYDTTDNSNAILSTTATTDGINGGIHCSVANTNSFRGDQNAYLYAKWEENKITTNRIFIGFQSGATHLPNNADTILDALDGAGLCIRTTDTVYQFCSNDGTGATAYATMTTTEDTEVHYVEIYTTNAGVTWCGKLDGGTAVCSSTSTDIPTPTDRLYVNSTGETDGGASAILWTQYLLYVQSDK